MNAVTSESLRTLFRPFETGHLQSPGKNARVLFLGARPGFRLPDGFEALLHPVQGFRPAFRALEAAGFAVTPRPEGDGYDLALVLCGRHRGANEAMLVDALARTKPGGMIVVAGARTDGIAALRRRAEEILPSAGHLSKYHGTVFWFERPDDAGATIRTLTVADTLVEGRFRTAPGMFSHDRVDPGSRALAGNIPADLRGAVADFGAGWGYLSAEILAGSPQLSRLDLYEADFESLQAAQRNLSGLPTTAALGFFWLDLLAEPVGRRYDAVVMNPPFHHGRAADPDIGRGMIRAAHRALRPGGRLWMVANRTLPYEAVLAEIFADHGEIWRDNSFKVLRARR
jgi:16S rRNA (guanine1207-N2)-methyltransferase